MKRIFAILAGVMMTGASAALADDNSVSISQVSSTPAGQGAKEDESSIRATNPGESGDYQNQVLSNPMISDIGRAESLTGGGGNTAVVIQSGDSNRSSVTQSGSNNYAGHSQTGNSNDITVNQQGSHNRSDEKQKGDNNHKTIIQNGQEREEDDEEEKDGQDDKSHSN